jgi:hypothetical protein
VHAHVVFIDCMPVASTLKPIPPFPTVSVNGHAFRGQPGVSSSAPGPKHSGGSAAPGCLHQAGCGIPPLPIGGGLRCGVLPLRCQLSPHQ